jgi:hypothetical protein
MRNFNAGIRNLITSKLEAFLSANTKEALMVSSKDILEALGYTDVILENPESWPVRIKAKRNNAVEALILE